MGDDERATQPRVTHGAPVEIDFETHTPPPVLVDVPGTSQTASGAAIMRIRGQKSLTAQEAINELWPARKAMPLLLELLQRQAASEARIDAMEESGPSAIAASKFGELRALLIGEDGEGGMLGEMKATHERDLADHKTVLAGVDERATKADKFVRRVIYAAAGTIGGSLIAAVALIYSAGEHAATARAESASARLMIDHKMDSLADSLTDLRGQVRLLLEERISHP